MWQHACKPFEFEQFDHSAVALRLLRTAGNDPTVMIHALSLGRTELRRDTANADGRRGVSILERAVAFLGVKPHANDASRGTRSEQ